jgi:hypothetical protein
MYSKMGINLNSSTGAPFFTSSVQRRLPLPSARLAPPPFPFSTQIRGHPKGWISGRRRLQRRRGVRGKEAAMAGGEGKAEEGRISYPCRRVVDLVVPSPLSLSPRR